MIGVTPGLDAAPNISYGPSLDPGYNPGITSHSYYFNMNQPNDGIGMHFVPGWDPGETYWGMPPGWPGDF